MDNHLLMAISPLDGRYQEKLKNMRDIFSEYGLMRFRFLIEIRWLQKLSTLDHFPSLNAEDTLLLNSWIENFSLADALHIKEIETKTNHDVKAIEYFIKTRFEQKTNLLPLTELIHFGCTSEDINNLAYALMLKTAKENIILPTLEYLIAELKNIAHQHADIAMLARTHGQPASPTTLGKEFANFAHRLEREWKNLKKIEILGKLNGASGNYNALFISDQHIDWPLVAKEFVESLHLTFNPYTTQIEPHDSMADYFSVLTRINTILIDFSRDIWSYIAINYLTQKTVKEEVGSSTMPHKINPIDFENAEGNLGIANALLQHMTNKLPISRWQRDLSDSTVLRNIGVALSHGYLAYLSIQKGLSKLAPNLFVIAHDLNHHWEVLAEAIQTVMRKFNLDTPYEQLKDLTRGKTIDQTLLQTFIKNLDLPPAAKEALLALTPEQYVGYATHLAKNI